MVAKLAISSTSILNYRNTQNLAVLERKRRDAKKEDELAKLEIS